MVRRDHLHTQKGFYKRIRRTGRQQLQEIKTHSRLQVTIAVVRHALNPSKNSINESFKLYLYKLYSQITICLTGLIKVELRFLKFSSVKLRLSIELSVNGIISLKLSTSQSDLPKHFLSFNNNQRLLCYGLTEQDCVEWIFNVNLTPYLRTGWRVWLKQWVGWCVHQLKPIVTSIEINAPLRLWLSISTWILKSPIITVLRTRLDKNCGTNSE